MNKAFCREPDADIPPRCPQCGGEGAAVGSATLQAHLLPAAQGLLGDPAYFCPTDSCPVAYYDLWERSIPVAEACGLFWPKDPAGPLCACHGLTCDDVDLDIAEGKPARVREAVRRAGLPGAECATRSADGRPCTARVQRYFLRRRAAGG